MNIIFKSQVQLLAKVKGQALFSSVITLTEDEDWSTGYVRVPPLVIHPRIPQQFTPLLIYYGMQSMHTSHTLTVGCPMVSLLFVVGIYYSICFTWMNPFLKLSDIFVK